MESKKKQCMPVTRKGIWDNWSSFAQIKPFTGYRTDHLCVLKTSIPSNSFNFSFGDDNVSEEDIETLLAFFGGTPFAFEVEETERKLIQKLENRGFVYRDFVLGMEMDLAHFKLKTYPKDIEVKEITSKNDFVEWLKIAEKGFYQPLYMLESFFSPIYQNKNVFHFYVAFFEGTPIGANFCHVKDGIAALFYITTLPDYQRRGVGSLLISHSIDTAKKRGAKKAVLQATDMGLTVYEKIGFRKICKYEDYTWKGQM